MSQFIPNLPMASIQGADYNPRRISPTAFEALKKSMGELGAIKPILVNQANNIIIAGHQRTKALKAIGETTVPAMMLPNVTRAEEMRFNQLHNASDLNFHSVEMKLNGLKDRIGYQWLPFGSIWMSTPPGNVTEANVRNVMIQMIAKFGNWGSVVCDRQGTILVSKQYAICTRILRSKVLAYVVSDEIAEKVKYYFGQDYGEYCYDGKNNKTYNQSFCQLTRLSDKKGAAHKKSRLYEFLVIPSIKKGMRILDFGAGRKEYAKKLEREGHDVTAVEFFEKDAGFRLNLSALDRDIDKVATRLKEGKRFDVVVCDSVLNSVNSMQAEYDVMFVVNMLCRMGGMMFVSGRPLEQVLYAQNRTKDVADKCRRGVEFLDSNNISAIYRLGKWTFQKFHDPMQRERLAKVFINTKRYGLHNIGGSWQICGFKGHEMPVSQMPWVFNREFDLPLPGGQTCLKHKIMVESMQYFIKNFPLGPTCTPPSEVWTSPDPSPTSGSSTSTASTPTSTASAASAAPPAA